MSAHTALRPAALALLIPLALLPGVARAQQGAVAPGGAELPIRITGTIPGYLELSARADPAPSPTRLLWVRVRANTPWELMARATGSGPRALCALRPTDRPGGWTVLLSGAPTALPCPVAHFAGEHDLRFEWARHGSGSDALTLELALVPTTAVEGMTPESLRSAQLLWPGDHRPPETPVTIADTVPAIIIFE